MTHTINHLAKDKVVRHEDGDIQLSQRVQVYGPHSETPELEYGTITNWIMGGFNNSKITGMVISLDEGGTMDAELSFWNMGVSPV